VKSNDNLPKSSSKDPGQGKFRQHGGTTLPGIEIRWRAKYQLVCDERRNCGRKAYPNDSI
jgi:hypothetical protein